MAAAHKASTQSETGGIVLIVDDDPALTRVMTQMLSLSGYHPLSANNGRDAVDLFCTHHREIKAVILDYCLPGTDGRQVHMKMRKVSHDVPIILSSGLGRQDIELDESLSGFAGFLQKPFGLKVLREALAEVL